MSKRSKLQFTLGLFLGAIVLAWLPCGLLAQTDEQTGEQQENATVSRVGRPQGWFKTLTAEEATGIAFCFRREDGQLTWGNVPLLLVTFDDEWNVNLLGRGESNANCYFECQMDASPENGDLVWLFVRDMSTPNVYYSVRRKKFIVEEEPVANVTGEVRIAEDTISGGITDPDDPDRNCVFVIYVDEQAVWEGRAKEEPLDIGQNAYKHTFSVSMTEDLDLPPGEEYGFKVIAWDEDVDEQVQIDKGSFVVPGEDAFAMEASPQFVTIPSGQGGGDSSTTVAVNFSFSGKKPNRKPGVVLTRKPAGGCFEPLYELAQDGSQWNDEGEYTFVWAVDRPGVYTFAAQEEEEQEIVQARVNVAAGESNVNLTVKPNVVTRPTASEGVKSQRLVFTVEGGTPKKDEGIVCVNSPNGSGYAPLNNAGNWDGDSFYMSFDVNSDMKMGEYVCQVETKEGVLGLCNVTIVESDAPFEMFLDPSEVVRPTPGTSTQVEQNYVMTFEGGSPLKMGEEDIDGNDGMGVYVVADPENGQLDEPYPLEQNDLGYWSGWGKNTCYFPWYLNSDMALGEWILECKSTDGRTATATLSVVEEPSSAPAQEDVSEDGQSN